MTPAVRLTSFSPGAGCGCKIGAADLGRVVAGLGVTSHPDLIVGTELGDDAMVWRRPDGQCLVASTDFFTPIVDDARTWGRIAAVNAVSDIYAMGATPMFGLNIVSWPTDLGFDLLAEVLAGGAEAAEAGGWIVAGGHTVDAGVPLYGQAIIGQIAEADLLTNAGGHPGDLLILTKPIGCGVIATALKRFEGAPLEDPVLSVAYREAVSAMTTLNDVASRVACSVGATACTDVTGFGLLGHLHKLAAASGVRAVVDPAEVPVFTGAWDLLAAGNIPGGTGRNLEFVEAALDTGGHDTEFVQMLADPQTSGGLLFSCAPERAGDALAQLLEAGLLAEDIGELLEVGDGAAGQVLLR